LSIQKLEALADVLLDVSAWNELDRWLDEQAELSPRKSFFAFFGLFNLYFLKRRFALMQIKWDRLIRRLMHSFGNCTTMHLQRQAVIPIINHHATH